MIDYIIGFIGGFGLIVLGAYIIQLDTKRIIRKMRNLNIEDSKIVEYLSN